MGKIAKNAWNWLVRMLWNHKKVQEVVEEHPHPQDNKGKTYRGWDNI
jgi:hypothetical protein